MKKIILIVIGIIFILYPKLILAEINSPKKAGVMSACLPGLGQAYNKKYWKIPVIYAGLIVSGYYIYENQKKYNHYKEAYLKNIDENPENDMYINEYSNAQILTLKDHYRRNREISLLCLGLTYIINIVDASVDAHLLDYEINEDLSLNIQPIFMAHNNFHGISLSLNL